ncbi:endonuclease NucS [Candidatus Bathyarchaeota archaeon]|nr:endonuclease NucS [Candidatus Bathyarchaeota archaeon]
MHTGRKAVVSVENPTLVTAAQTVRTALMEHKAVIAIGNCIVEYKGRASSKLESGERIVIIKEDGSVLVHRPTDYSPVNWQPPGCLFQTEVINDKLKIRAIRLRPKELIVIIFDKIYLLATLSLVDEGEFSLYASEEDMRKVILANPSLIEPGFRPITYEKKIEPGFVDVYGVDRNGKLVVVEIKRKTAGKDAVLQLQKYIESIRGMVQRDVRGILVAPDVARAAQPLLYALALEFKPLSPRQCAEILSSVRTQTLSKYFKNLPKS